MFFGLIKRKSSKDNGNALAALGEAQEAAPVPDIDKYWPVYKSWQPRLERMSNGLNKISRDIEEEFLSVGGNLQEFSDNCSKISSLAGEIAHMLESGSGFKSEAFKAVFQKAYSEIESCCSVISDKVCRMGDLTHSIQDISSLKLFLDKLSKAITIVGTLIRIETSRVEEAEFETMTGAIDDLAQQIAKNTAEVALSANHVNEGISAINLKMAESSEKIHKELDLTKERMAEIVEEMQAMTEQAKWACKRMEGRSTQIAPEIGNVIVALQSHDICRQQMQHVSEALLDIISKISSMNSLQETGKASFGHWITEAVGIQILQLEHVVSEASAAARGISDHLSRISDLADAQQEDATMILEDEESGSGRIVKISSELESLSTLMSDGKAMMIATIDEISAVNNVVGSMSEQVANIEMISDNINLLALNAIIKVARTGEAGRGLGVLADEIRKLSTKANDEITKGAAAINSILASSSELGQTLSEEMNRRLVSIEDVFKQTHSAVDELLDADKTMMKSMGGITAITKTLDEEIAQVVSDIKFDATIRAGIGEMVEELRKMLADVEATIPEGSHQPAMDLEDLKSRYTIQSERDIHESRSTSNVKEEAASNVEFF